MQKITPHLWFNTQAPEAAAFYTSIFEESRVTHSVTLTDTPSGDSDVISFQLLGQSFMAINGGPLFTINPSISFMVNYDPSRMADAASKLRANWEKLSEGGKVMMPLQKYPFSELYGWVEDKYGVSWQLILTDPEGEPRPAIIPSFLFVGEVYGKAKEAGDFYCSVFPDAERGIVVPYGPGAEHDKPDATMFSDFRLFDVWFSAMDSALQHGFSFNEAVSLRIRCENQEEIDYYWQKLSAVPEAEQCGWLKDSYGVSWQITPRRLDEMMATGTPEQIARVTQAFLPMKKFDLAALERAFAGE